MFRARREGTPRIHRACAARPRGLRTRRTRWTWLNFAGQTAGTFRARCLYGAATRKARTSAKPLLSKRSVNRGRGPTRNRGTVRLALRQHGEGVGS